MKLKNFQNNKKKQLFFLIGYFQIFKLKIFLHLLRKNSHFSDKSL